MKKSLGQTIRNLKRVVNKKVLKVPGVEQKILDATSNEPWWPHGSHLGELAQASRNFHDCQTIMDVIWKRINDTGKNWRHVSKALTVLEYLVEHGAERVIDEIRDHIHQISALFNFHYVDSAGRDQGSNVRRKSKSLVAFVNDKERIQEVRQIANARRHKYRNQVLPEGSDRLSSNSFTGGYDDRYADDGLEDHHGYRDEQNDRQNERGYDYVDDDRYERGMELHNLVGDMHGSDNIEHYGSDGYRDADYRGHVGVDFRPGHWRSANRNITHSVDYDDHYLSRRSEHQISEPNYGEAPCHKEATKDAQSPINNEKSSVSLPAYKSSSPSAPEPTSPSEGMGQFPIDIESAKSELAPFKEIHTFDEFDPRGYISDLPAPAFTNSLAQTPVTSILTISEAEMPVFSGFGMDIASTTIATSQPYTNPFGDAPFEITSSWDFSAQPHTIAPVNSFQPSSVVSFEPFPPLALEVETCRNNPNPKNGQHSSVNPAFLAQEMLQKSDILDDILPRSTESASDVPSQLSAPSILTNTQTTQTNFLPLLGVLAEFPQQATSIPLESAQSAYPMQATDLNLQQEPAPVSLPSQTVPSISLAAQCSDQNNIHSANMSMFQQPRIPRAASLSSLAVPGSLKEAQTAAPFSPSPQTGLSASPSLPFRFTRSYSHSSPSTTSNNKLSAHLNHHQQHPGLYMHLASEVAGQPAETQPSTSEPKLAVWADVLSRGLVDLNISGAKINPLAGIGIDLDSIHRMERRKEVKCSAASVTSTMTMGKAVGAGSGLSPAAAGGSAPPNPMGMSCYGWSMNHPSIGTGMAMNRVIIRGAKIHPQSGMPPPGPSIPGVGYNPRYR